VFKVLVQMLTVASFPFDVINLAFGVGDLLFHTYHSVLRHANYTIHLLATFSESWSIFIL
jgi:hypothetical protein